MYAASDEKPLYGCGDGSAIDAWRAAAVRAVDVDVYDGAGDLARGVRSPSL